MSEQNTHKKVSWIPIYDYVIVYIFMDKEECYLDFLPSHRWEFLICKN